MSLILPKQLNQSNITKPYLAVCEGISDATFIDRLLRHAGIGNCSVGCPSTESVGGQGVDKIPQYLAGIGAITRGGQVLQGIIVVADADQTARKKFKVISQGLKDAGFPRPHTPFKIYRPIFRVAVYLIPKKGKRGTLEDLLIEAALKRYPRMVNCVDQFGICTGKVRNWKSNQRAKMRLSALVSATCEKNPFASTNTMWGDRNCPVPIGSSCFSEIRTFLINFCA